MGTKELDDWYSFSGRAVLYHHITDINLSGETPEIVRLFKKIWAMSTGFVIVFFFPLLFFGTWETGTEMVEL